MSSQPEDRFVDAGLTLDELREAEGQRSLLDVGGRHIVAFYHEDEVHAVDNRCPHMGFPLTEGTVDDGILTCHWHHARFELSCGDTFDPFADDVQAYSVEVRDGRVFVDPNPARDESPEEHWTGRLEHGLRENLSLVIAKAVIGLDGAGVPYTEPVLVGAKYGTHYREGGWGRGLTTLGAMANLLDDVRLEDRRRALYAGLTEVASEASGEAPFFPQDALDAEDVSAERLKRWFRDNVEVRDSDGAERVLRTAIREDLPESEVAGMLFAAATDHLYLDTGHRLDFVNKAFETLDHVGWEHADDLLPSLAPGLASASRAEERSSWRQPVDVAGLLFETYEDLPDLVATGADETWEEPDDLGDTLLSDDPHAIVDALTDAVAAGATAEELARVVAYAAARRVAQFGTSNEFNDWNTVHHTYTYANAVHGAARRTDAWEVYRGAFDAAMSVYLDRFLNMPPAPIPDPGESDREPDAVLDDLLETFEVERDEEVDRAGRFVGEYLDVAERRSTGSQTESDDADGDVSRLKRTLGEALLREDAGFHTRQNVEAAFEQHEHCDDDRGRVHLIATARYLSAHTPTRRSGEQTFRIADRLNRGEKIHEAASSEAVADDD